MRIMWVYNIILVCIHTHTQLYYWTTRVCYMYRMYILCIVIILCSHRLYIHVFIIKLKSTIWQVLVATTVPAARRHRVELQRTCWGNESSVPPAFAYNILYIRVHQYDVLHRKHFVGRMSWSRWFFGRHIIIMLVFH